MLTILNVDDCQTNLFIVNKTLQNIFEDATIIDCNDGVEAIERYTDLINSNYELSLIVCDYHMPNLNGKGVLKKMREMGYKGMFVILTADVNTTIDDFPNADIVLHKPFKRDDFESALTCG